MNIREKKILQFNNTIYIRLFILEIFSSVLLEHIIISSVGSLVAFINLYTISILNV